MHKMRDKPMVASVIVIFNLLSVSMLSAQSIWLDRSHDKMIALEYLKPDFKDKTIFTAATSIWFLSLRYPIVEKVNLVAELPYIIVDIDLGDIEGFSEDKIGNPYLGIELGKKKSPVLGEIGFRLPLAPDDEGKWLRMYAGKFIDYDRMEAFLPKWLSLIGMINYDYKNHSGFKLRVRGGTIFSINTEKDFDEDDTELKLGYSAQIGYEIKRVNILAGVTFNWSPDKEDDYNFNEEGVHQLGLAISVSLGRIRPGFHFKYPLDKELEDVIDFVFGFNLGVQFDE